jgi:hypothetical protein
VVVVDILRRAGAQVWRCSCVPRCTCEASPRPAASNAASHRSLFDCYVLVFTSRGLRVYRGAQVDVASVEESLEVVCSRGVKLVNLRRIW